MRTNPRSTGSPPFVPIHRSPNWSLRQTPLDYLTGLPGIEQKLGLGHFEGRAGADFITTPVCLWPLMASWFFERSRFSPPPVLAISDYASPSRRVGHAARRVRPEQNNPHSIETFRSSHQEQSWPATCLGFRAVPFVDRVPDSPRHRYRRRLCRTPGASDSGPSARAHRADQPRSAFPMQCSASSPATPVAPDRSRSHRRIGNRVRAAPRHCSAPGGADRTSEEGRHKRQKWAAGS
jgi:hypothetical protein